MFRVVIANVMMVSARRTEQTATSVRWQPCVEACTSNSRSNSADDLEWKFAIGELGMCPFSCMWAPFSSDTICRDAINARAVEIDLIILIGQRKYDTDATKTAMEYAMGMGGRAVMYRAGL